MQTTVVTLARAAARGDDTAFESLTYIFAERTNWICSRYFLPGGERCDIEQRALVGLWKACRDWRPGKASFVTFALLCMQREVITAVNEATRGKHTPLNTGRALDEPVQDAKDTTLADMLVDPGADPACRLEAKERLRVMSACLATMSDLERDALVMTEAHGVSYDDAAARLGATPKAVDNALQRARRKLALAMRDIDAPAQHAVRGTRSLAA